MLAAVLRHTATASAAVRTAQLLRTLSEMLAAIRRHAAVAWAAARMAAAMLRLHCLASLLRTIDCSACGGAQARSYALAAAGIAAMLIQLFKREHATVQDHNGRGVTPEPIRA